MSHLSIGIIVGRTRPGCNGRAVADWLLEQAAGRDAAYELVDLADHPLPLLDEPLPPSLGQYQGQHTMRWAQTVAAYDGFVFVTPEYNRSTSAALKNALDYVYAEWNDKAAAYVGYGSMGGARAIEHLRGMAAELQMADIRLQLDFFLATDFRDYRDFAPSPYHAELAQALFDQLERWAGALKPLRR